MTSTKNLTITVSNEDYQNLEFVLNYFQEQSISKVSKSDLIKFMVLQFKIAIENDKLEEVRTLIRNLENNSILNDNDNSINIR